MPCAAPVTLLSTLKALSCQNPRPGFSWLRLRSVRSLLSSPSAGLKAGFDPRRSLALAWSKLRGAVGIFVVFEMPGWKMNNNISASGRAASFVELRLVPVSARPSLPFCLAFPETIRAPFVFSLPPCCVAGSVIIVNN